MRKSLLLVVVISFFFACTKEKTITVEKQYHWKRDMHFVGENCAILNSYAGKDTLFLIGKDYHLLTDTSTKSYPENFSLIGTSNPNQKLPLNNDFYVLTSIYGLLHISPSKNPVLDYSDFQLDMTRRDSTFSCFYYIYYYSGLQAVINKNNQVLVPYATKNSGISFLLVDVKLKHEDYGNYIDTTSCKIIRFPKDGEIRRLFSNKDYFLMSMHQGTYKMYPDGTYRLFNRCFSNIFQCKDILFGVFWDDLYKSIDDGENWTKITSVSNLRLCKFYQIDNEIIGTYESQIFHIKLSEPPFSSQEIDNDGLENNYITSVSKFKDKIYITTLSGVYYRNARDFWTYKVVKTK